MQPRVDGRPQLDRTGHRTESIMRLANRLLQHLYSGTSALVVRELHIEVNLDIGDMVAVLALGAVAGAADLEAHGFGPFDCDGVDVH
jgi:hypothetical protein